MAQHLNALFIVTGWAFLVGASGAFFALGIVGVCRWLKWAPINITINNYTHLHEDGPSPRQEKP